MQSLSRESHDIQSWRKATRDLISRHWAYAAPAAADDPSPALRQLWDGGVGQGWTSLTDSGPEWLAYGLVLLEELGRGLAPLPVIDALLLDHLAGPGSAYAEDLHAGTLVPALAWGEWSGDPASGQFEYDEDGFVSGTVHGVELAGVATHLLAPVEERRWALIDLSHPAVTTVEAPGLAHPAWSTVHATAAPATMVDTDRALLDLLVLARLGSAARANGSARRAAELALDYAHSRHQFGQPIGRFQAVQHRLVDAAVQLDTADLMVRNAARAFAEKSDDWAALAAAAVQRSATSARQVTRAAHLTFGGVSLFEEHEVPGHFRRVHADSLRWGGPRSSAEDAGRHALEGERVFPHDDPLRAHPAIRAEVRSFLADYQASTGRAFAHGHAVDPAFSEALGDRGLIGLSWPVALGGRGLGVRDQLAVLEELEYAGAPVDGHLVPEWMIGPAILANGTEGQLQSLVPPILAGKLRVSIGYSEPAAGSDLSALTSRARLEGDHWVVNAAKVFMSWADTADLCVLAVRTDDTDNPRHGITLLLVPMDAPGVTVHRDVSFGGHPACSVFFDDVRVPADSVLGDRGRGWNVIIGSFTHERLVMGSYVYDLRRALEVLVAELRHREARGGLPVERYIAEIGELSADIQAAGLLVVRCLEDLEAEDPLPHHSAMAKVYTASLGERLAEIACELLGATALLHAGSPAAVADGLFEWWQRDSLLNVIAGGTVDNQRNAIATRGLGLPH